MAKSGKSSPKKTQPQAQVKKTAPVVVAKAPKDWLARPALPAPDQRQTLIFWGLALAGLIYLVALSFGSGINADDKFQCDYSTKLVNYYSSFGKDTAALNIPAGKMHLYGGFFEIVTGFANKALGYEQNTLAYHNVRHASSAMLGWLAILCAALLAQLIAGWRAGVITLVLMLLSPRFVGDSMMNPKDIPFAAGYMLALYNMVAVLDKLPTFRRWNMVGLIAGLAMSLATRAGGLLSFAILFLFAGLHFLLKNGRFSALFDIQKTKKYLLIALGATVAGYVLALFFWPYALQSPLKNPFIALSKFSDLEVKIKVLFEGSNVMSDLTPWYYGIKWIVYTIPLAVLIGFAGAFVLFARLAIKYNPLWVFLAFFGAVFPVFYVIYKHSIIHDGWRHLTFAYPTMAVTAALFWNELYTFFSRKNVANIVVTALLAVCVADAAGFIVRNPQFPYVYFNQLAGGIKGAYGKYETDYWEVSTRQGIEWLEQQGILKPDMPEMVVIATNAFYSTKMLTAKYGDKVKVKYLKWEKRCDDAWDYALYPTRFLDGSTLQRGKWPPDNAVHVVEADGVPLLAVLKDNGKNCSLAMAAMKLGNWQGAIDFMKKEIENVPDNDLAWSNLGQAYINSNQLEEAKAAAEKTMEISPDDMQANNLIGMYWMYKNDLPRAKAQLEGALRRVPSNAGAWFYLALIAQQEGNQDLALDDLMNTIQNAPNFRQAYELSIQIYESQGNHKMAEKFKAALADLK